MKTRFALAACLLFACMQFVSHAGAASPLPLAGDWSFEMDRADEGEKARWFTRKLTDRIVLPGMLQAQGLRR